MKGIFHNKDCTNKDSYSSDQVTLPELTPAGYAVLTVNATDLDIGDNAKITYSMGVAPVQGFTIDPVTGM